MLPVCKARWANIRDNFRKSLKKQKTKNDQQATKEKLYKYSEQLSFLKKFFEERETKTNIDEEVDTEDFTGDTRGEQVFKNKQITQTEGSSASEVNGGVTVQLESQSSLKSTLTPFHEKFESCRYQTSSAPPKTAAATVMEYILKGIKIWGTHYKHTFILILV